MTQGKNLGTNFTDGRMMPLMLRFMLPFLLANLLNNVYNTVDTIIIGQFVGSAGTVAVSMGGRVLVLCTMVGTALAGGGQVLISQLYGAGRREELNSSIGTLLSIMLLSSVVMAVLGFCLARPVLEWMNTPVEAFDGAMDYFRITCVGLPLTFGYNAVSAVLRGMGDSKNPLLFIAIAAVINLVGDLIFVLAFGMGPAGTAYATVIGQGISLIFSLFLLYHRRAHFGFDFRRSSFRIDRGHGAVILKIGLPMALRSFFIQFTQMFLMQYINAYGLTEATIYSVASKVNQLANIFSMSVRQAAGTIMAQNVGAEKPQRVKSALYCSLTITLCAAALMATLTLLFPRQLFGLFSRDEAVLAYAASFALVCSLLYFFSAVLGPYDSVVTATGNSTLGFAGGVLDGVLFRLGFGFLFAWGLDLGVVGFFLGDAMARLGPILIGVIYYYSGAWKRYRILKS